MGRIVATRLSRVVADRLQQKIICEHLSAGVKLPTEPELMNEFGVSRTVIREAAALLVSRGIVQVRPRRGMTVRAPDGVGIAESLTAQLQMSRVSFAQLLQVRLTLETAVARIAAGNWTEQDLVALEKNLAEMSESTIERERMVELDVEFHELLAHATHNPFFHIVSRPINELLRTLYIDKVGYLSMRERTLQEHRAIVSAVTHCNPEEADRATREHLNRVGASVERLLEESEEVSR